MSIGGRSSSSSKFANKIVVENPEFVVGGPR